VRRRQSFGNGDDRLWVFDFSERLEGFIPIAEAPRLELAE
jgi:hypothetical protein